MLIFSSRTVSAWQSEIQKRRKRGSLTHSTHLLSNHDCKRRCSCTPDPRDGEQLDETLDKGVASKDTRLDLELSVNVVEIAAGLKTGEPESTKRAERLGVSTLAHQPTRTLGAEKDEQSKGKGGNEAGSELQTPRDSARVNDHDVGAETDEDAKC